MSLNIKIQFNPKTYFTELGNKILTDKEFTDLLHKSLQNPDIDYNNIPKLKSFYPRAYC